MVNQQSGQTGREGFRSSSSSSLNKVMLIGNLGADPEMRFTPSGNPVTTFRIAVNRVFNSPEGDRKDETEWFSIVTWSKLAETCNQYLTKGQKVYCEGRLHNRNWEGADGQKHYRTEIIASHVIFLDKKGASTNPEDKIEDGEPGEIEPQDIPF
jgi:single-strand DNA-binding protein